MKLYTKNIINYKKIIITNLLILSLFSISICMVFINSVMAESSSSAVTSSSMKKEDKQYILIKIGNYTNDLHSAFMGMKMASGLQKRGNNVTIFLNLEAVRIADKRHPLNLGWGHNDTLQPIYENFVKDGGKILVCPHCAMVAGIKKEHLRDGANLPKGDELMVALEKADKIIDY